MKNLKNGVYILHNEKLFTIEDWKKQSDPTIADFVVLVTDYGAMKISKKIEGEIIWKEAMKFDLPDSVQGHIIGINKDVLKKAIKLIGGEWSDNWCWTSTEYGASHVWIYGGYDGLMDADSKLHANYVRAVTVFQLPNSNFKEEHKPIDNVTVELVDVGLRAVGIKAEKSMIDKIIDIVELIEDKGEATSLKDIAELENKWNKENNNE